MKLKALVAALILAFVGYVVASPYLAVRSMRRAADARDAATLSGYVDYPSVRESLKANVHGKIGALTGADSPFGALGAAMATALADPMIDALVTPDSLAAMLEGNVPDRAAAPLQVAAPGTEVETSMGYASVNTFLLDVRAKGVTTVPIRFVMTRHGLASWRLSSVTLP